MLLGREVLIVFKRHVDHSLDTHATGVGLETDHHTGSGLNEVDMIEFQLFETEHLRKHPRLDVFVDDLLRHLFQNDRLDTTSSSGNERNIELIAVEAHPSAARIEQHPSELLHVPSFVEPERVGRAGFKLLGADEKDRVGQANQFTVENNMGH